MKTDIYKSKNFYGEFTAQLDRDGDSISIVCDMSKRRDELTKSCKKVLNPMTEKQFMEKVEEFISTPYKDLYQDGLLLDGMRDAARFSYRLFHGLTKS